MNARLYDPRIGKFFSPDNFITDPENPQNYNRYSYALNNPLKYTDPTGNYLEWTEPFDGSTMISPPRRAGLTLSLLLDIHTAQCRMGSMSIIDYNKLDFALATGTFTSFTSEYLYSGGSGSGGGSGGSSPADPEKKAKTKAGGGGKLPEDVIITEDLPVDQAQIIQDTYDEDKKDFEEVYPGYEVPLDTKIYVAPGEYIAENSSFKDTYDFLLGLAKWDKKEIWLSSELFSLPNRENLLEDPNSNRYKYRADNSSGFEFYNSLEALTHEVGHFQGYIIYGKAEYISWSFNERENQARSYTNVVRGHFGRKLELYNRWWGKSSSR